MLPRDLRWGLPPEGNRSGWEVSQDLYDTRTMQLCRAYRRVVNYPHDNDRDWFSCHYPTGLPPEVAAPDDTHPEFRTKYFNDELHMLCWLTFCEEAHSL